MTTPHHSPDLPGDDARPTSESSGEETTARAVPADSQTSLREQVLTKEKSEFGGVKIGSAFFGWLTATGTAVLLTALVAALGAAVGLSSSDTDDLGEAASKNADTVGWVGAIALLIILLIAYYCGGYVAGRMARFDGLKQGVAVWVWAVVVAVITAIAGSQYDILGTLNSFPRVPSGEGSMTAVGIITLVIVAIASLIGAILGGLAGMRYHRRIDRAGLGR